MQNIYDHELSFYESFDATDFVSGRTCNSTSSPKLSPLSSSSGGLFPRASIGKPRRSRASKKAAATTLLTADATNFRALVQQFTGCHSGPPSHKGPINLNFEQYNYNSEKPVTRNMIDHESGQSLVSFRANDNIVTTKMMSEGELFVSRFNQNSRPDPLTLDDFDEEKFSLQEIMSGHGDHYSAASIEDDLWGW